MVKKSTHFLKKLRNYSVRIKLQEVCGNQLIFDAIPQTFHSKIMASSVQMSIEAAAHIIALQQLQNLRAFVPLVPGRIMQKYEFRQIPR
jgi:hypothetical protein